MSFKIIPTENRKVKYITLSWNFDTHPISVGGEFQPFSYLEDQNSSNLVIPKGSIIVFSMSETVTTLNASGNVLGVWINDGSANWSPAGVIPNTAAPAGTIYIQQWGDQAFRKTQGKSTLKLYSFGAMNQGVINFTVGFLPGAGYEYLNE